MRKTLAPQLDLAVLKPILKKTDQLMVEYRVILQCQQISRAPVSTLRQRRMETLITPLSPWDGEMPPKNPYFLELVTFIFKV